MSIFDIALKTADGGLQVQAAVTDKPRRVVDRTARRFFLLYMGPCICLYRAVCEVDLWRTVKTIKAGSLNHAEKEPREVKARQGVAGWEVELLPSLILPLRPRRRV